MFVTYRRKTSPGNFLQPTCQQLISRLKNFTTTGMALSQVNKEDGAKHPSQDSTNFAERLMTCGVTKPFPIDKFWLFLAKSIAQFV